METFKQTSNEPYVRHDYKLVTENGEEFLFDNYEDVQLYWFQRSGFCLSHIEVLDKKKTKGFKIGRAHV